MEDGRGLGDLGSDVAPAHSVHSQSEANILLDAHVGVQSVGLEDHRHASFRGIEIGHIARSNPDLAAAHLLEPGDHPEQR